MKFFQSPRLLSALAVVAVIAGLLTGGSCTVSTASNPPVITMISLNATTPSGTANATLTAAIQAANGKRLFYREPVRKAV